MIPSYKFRFMYSANRILEHFSPLNSLKTYAQRNQTSLSHKAYNEISSYEGQRIDIPRVKGLTPKQIKKKYINKGIPVILEGEALAWSALKNWHPSKLNEKYGTDKIKIFEADPTIVEDPTYEIKDSTLSEIFKSMEEEDPTKYSRFNRLLYDHPELLSDFNYKWLYKMRCWFSSGKTFQVFLGASRSVTSLHAASEHNLFTQVYGEKHWYILDARYDILLKPPVSGSPYFYTSLNPEKPDLDRYPAFKHMDIYETVLKPGDILFNPPSFWHQVTNKTSSIGVGFRWFGAIDCFRLNFTQALLTICAKNPPIWIAKKYRTDFAKIFKYMNDQR